MQSNDWMNNLTAYQVQDARRKPIYTEEVAKKLKLSRFTIYEMIKRGEHSGSSYRLSLRITESQFETYLIRQAGHSILFIRDYRNRRESICLYKGNKGNILLLGL